ncbi:murein biosynthesis integral membrane protein MurJ [Candidatus Roizmanbacteria bacterium RIFCSPHIGHO2_02_FULL_37_15]|uniref:Probable lipid II flippase MurJ n=1 Tax=Candidatus Roizmanbacteria bacterium RIFCSPLOWO2_01_FULL_37_16 TaxID=1802058 RepID=A0A1F7IIT8_9BACT|nr:MAG: murein biosynthesis integral membrane protein MurJ [Candidatus Roizmanbacteria bacterium RIFCSPHIGHO2_01_FULL_37_16b]OGK20422.1 MAG: murein biosynthesis integral membrane protein MurJ [Candidatus Roizmanbacteria bacterium RIFCSPHIGHO2_02_FULL_37_15]OGK34023.1 MAG: murein biosynthesis integral membrane protein MurJ [Candidatus Roizmanbacteria bacterium RIFCSPHIGHO2_12_FULL_36_11]OGK43273.1 MAG: murein biosynthesis integral membrane protein MurJ [Candidatus Roizmanbacteria bacterium RIFCSP
MNKIIDRTKQFIFTKQTSMFSSAILLAFMIAISRLFGFLRYRTLSGLFTKEELDVFFASFRIPDLIFEILMTGALTSTFIPIFIKYQNNKEDLSANISSIINLILVIMGTLILILFFSMSIIVPIITPGFGSQKIEAVILYSQLLLLGQLPFLIIGNFLTGIGQANKMFFLPALAPITYNLSIIISALFLSSSFYLLAPIIGVMLGAVLFVFIQLPILTSTNFVYALILKKTSGMIEFFKIVVPRTLTVILAQIDATIDLILATLLGAGSYTVFYFAQHLQLLPVSVIGIAFGQASLPYLTEVFQQKKIEEFKKIIADSVLNLFFLTIPVMSFFIFARTPIVRLFFGGQKFDWEATVSTAITLSFFSLSLPFHTVYYFLTRCFYAFLDTKTPFLISMVTIAINTILSVVFVMVLKLPVWFLAASFSSAMILNVILLFIILSKKIGGLDFRLLIIESIKMTFATVFSSLIVYYLMKFMDGLIFDTAYTINVFFLLLTGGLLYLMLYLFVSWFLDVREIYLVGKLFIKAREYRKKIIEFYTVYE